MASNGTSPNSHTSVSTEIELSSLGRIAKLGDFYDSRTDSFNGCWLSSRPPQDLITLTEKYFTDLRLIVDDKISTKLDKLNVNGSLKLSVLTDLVPITGSAKYLKKESTSSTSSSCSLVYYIETAHVKMDILSPIVKEKINHDIFTVIPATHVVVGVQYGGNVILDVKIEDRNSTDIKKASVGLKVDLGKICQTLKGDGSVRFSDEDIENSKKFEFRIFGDIAISSIPEDYKTALELLKEVPRLVKEANDGKGVPIKYTLLPIKIVKDYYKLESNLNLIYKEIEDYHINKFVDFFDDLIAIKTKFTSLFNEAEDLKMFMDKSSYDGIKNFKYELTTSEIKLIIRFKDILVSVRSGQSDSADIINLLSGYQNELYSYDNSLDQLKKFKLLLNKYLVHVKILESGINFIAEDDDLDRILLKFARKKLYIFYYMNSATKQQVDQFLTIVKHKKNAGNIYYFTDNETRPDLNEDGQLKLNLYLNGQSNGEDVLSEEYHAIFNTYLIIIRSNRYTPFNHNSYVFGSYAYNINNEQLLPISMDFNYNARFAVINDFMYAFGGSNKKEETNEVFRINVKKNFPFKHTMAWTRCGRLSIFNNNKFLWSFTVYEEKIYLIFSDHLQVFDPKTNRIQVLGPSETFRQLHNYKGTLIGLIPMYFELMHDSICAYNQDDKKWNKISSLPDDEAGECSSVLIYDDLYLIGGVNKKTLRPLNSFKRFNLITKTWTNLPNMIHARRWPQVTVINGNIYAINEVDAEDKVNSIEMFDSKSRKWHLLNVELPSDLISTNKSEVIMVNSISFPI